MLTAMLAVDNILAGERLYDVWKVNQDAEYHEDGDRPEKRAFCETHGLKYVVLKRTPKEGLAKRSSTDLRGF